MWCTRWFLPLLLLPLPTAPPYFLLLFLFSLTMHAKPCFYCIILLTTLFVSSCYWQPFPLDSQLSTPWADNITTFKDALVSTIAPNYTKPLPSVMRAVDRCWCDFSNVNFFEPFDVSHWEHVSIERLKDELERKEKAEEVQKSEGEGVKSEPAAPVKNASLMPRTIAPTPSARATPTIARKRSLWSWFRMSSTQRGAGSVSGQAPVKSSPKDDRWTGNRTETRGSYSNTNLPWFRKVYDLRPYGFDMILDFGWTREKPS